jgi:2-polyprenyl-6-methoxyphenol hydroxylase-like FAD-dependent oxidoreductase
MMRNASHGHRFQLFSRKDFVKLLYDNAPRRSERILTNKEIVSIEQDDNGVKVSCSDDSKYEGDILIGADGVRSQVRRQLFNEDKETMPFTAEFKAVVSSFWIQFFNPFKKQVLPNMASVSKNLSRCWS